MTPSSMLIEREIVTATPEVSAALVCDLGEAVINLRRLRLADGLPMVIESAYFRLVQCKAVLYADLEHGSLYNTLHTECGLNLSHCSETIELSYCDLETSKYLTIPVGSPIFLLKRITYAEPGAVEYVISQCRTDRYMFAFELRL